MSKRKTSMMVITIILVMNAIAFTFLENAGRSNNQIIQKQAWKQPGLKASGNSSLFTGMYANYSVSFSGSNEKISYNYIHNSSDVFNVTRINSVHGTCDYTVSNSTRRVWNWPDGHPNNGYTRVWIHNNVSLNDKLMISNGWSETHEFNVSGEDTITIPEYGVVDVWILTELYEHIFSDPSRAFYEKSTGLLINGTFYHSEGTHYITYDFEDSNAEFEYAGNKEAPELTEGKVSSTSGNQQDQLNFSVTYTDEDNNDPVNISVILNGTRFPMEKIFPSDTNFTNGCEYQFLTYLQPGIYNYSFECWDFRYQNYTQWKMDLVISSVSNLNQPTLTNQRVDPPIGFNDTTIFRYEVNYTDLDNDAPKHINITINGTIYQMQKKNWLDSNYMDGCMYHFNTYLSEVGNYNYSFNASDGSTKVSLGHYQGPDVRQTPFFTGMYLNHSLYFSDGGTSGPSSFNYEKNGERVMKVEWERFFYSSNSTHCESLDSRIIINSTGWSSPHHGYHTFIWIFPNVSIGDEVLIANFRAVSLERRLEVIGEQYIFIPSRGYIETWVLDGINYDDTAYYDKQTGLLINGTFQYYGGGTPYYYAFTFEGKSNAPIGYVTNDHEPELTEGKVNPTSGTQGTQFNFSVVYTDADNTFPTHVNVTVNETTYQMSKVNPMDNDYRDGCVYQYLGYFDANPFNYTYYFNCSEWKFSNYTQHYDDLEVKQSNDNAPTIQDAKVTPEIHDKTKKFNFTALYFDLDNNLPQKINITIDSITHDMIQADPSDLVAVDGKLYYYATTFPDNGTHQFKIKAFDGEYSTESTWIEGPEINPFYYPQNFTIFEDDFESGLSKWSQIDGLWHLTDDTSSTCPDPYHSETHSMWFGQESSGDYDTGSRAFGCLRTVAIDLSQLTEAFLEFYHWRNAEDPPYADQSIVQVSTNGFYFENLEVYEVQDISPWQHVILNLSDYCGQSRVYIQFYFDTQDSFGNGYTGWLIDDVKVYVPVMGTQIVLNSPTDWSSVHIGEVEFTWNGIEESFGPLEYTFQLSNQSNFQEIYMEETGISHQSGTISLTKSLDSLEWGAYFWRVKSNFQGFDTRWSRYLAFGLMTPPESFTLGSNATDGKDADGTFMLNWTASKHATSYEVFQSGQFITEINETACTSIKSTTDLQLALTNYSAGTYYFIVRASNQNGKILSNCIKIAILPTSSYTLGLPGVFTLTSNADDPDKDGTFTLNWSLSASATSYKIYQYNACITVINDTVGEPINITSTLNYTLSGLEDGRYYFIVEAVNSDGSTLSNCVKVVVSKDSAQESNLIVPIIVGTSIIGGGIGIAGIGILLKKRKSVI